MISPDLSPRYAIVPLPCGCVTEIKMLRAYEAKTMWPNAIIECPWCRSTFFATEFKLWIEADVQRPLVMSRPPRPLLWDGDKFFESTGRRCGCGAPILRRSDGEMIHYSPEDNQLEAARN